MNVVKKLFDTVLSILCIALLAILVILVTWQVITRFVLDNPSAITEELAKYCFVWLILFGAAFVFGENGHMRIEFIQDRLPPKLRMSVQIFIELSIIFFSGFVLIKGGLATTSLAWTQMSAALKVPVGYLYTAMPLSGTFIVFYSLYNIYFIVKNKTPLESH